MNTCIVDKTPQCSLCKLQTEVFRGPNLCMLYLLDVYTYTQTINVNENTQKEKEREHKHTFLNVFYKYQYTLKNKGSLLASVLP